MVIPPHLHSDGVFVFPLHVVDVPGDRRHGDDGVLHHLIPRVALIEVLRKFLRGKNEMKPNKMSECE